MTRSAERDESELPMNQPSARAEHPKGKKSRNGSSVAPVRSTTSDRSVGDAVNRLLNGAGPDQQHAGPVDSSAFGPTILLRLQASAGNAAVCDLMHDRQNLPRPSTQRRSNAEAVTRKGPTGWVQGPPSPMQRKADKGIGTGPAAGPILAGHHKQTSDSSEELNKNEELQPLVAPDKASLAGGRDEGPGTRSDGDHVPSPAAGNLNTADPQLPLPPPSPHVAGSAAPLAQGGSAGNGAVGSDLLSTPPSVPAASTDHCA